MTEQEGTPTRIPLSEEEQEKDIVYTEINSVADFIKIRENLSGNYKLMSDIDLSKVTKDDKNVGKLAGFLLDMVLTESGRAHSAVYLTETVTVFRDLQ